MDRTDSPPPLVPTGTKVGWRRPALVLAAVLVGLVGLVRLGAPAQRPVVTPTDVRPSAVAALPTAVATLPTVSVSAPPSAPPTATPAPTGAPLTRGRISGVIPRSADGLTYVDGIPTGISGESVYRVRDALLVPVGRTLLVGGWSRPYNCLVGMTGRSCPSPTLSDVPLGPPSTGDLTTTFVALDAPLAGRGAHIVLVSVEPDPRCSIHGVSSCLPRLHVLQQIWSDGAAIRPPRG